MAIWCYAARRLVLSYFVGLSLVVQRYWVDIWCRCDDVGWICGRWWPNNTLAIHSFSYSPHHRHKSIYKQIHLNYRAASWCPALCSIMCRYLDLLPKSILIGYQKKWIKNTNLFWKNKIHLRIHTIIINNKTNWQMF